MTASVAREDLVLDQDRILECCGDVEFPRVGLIGQRWDTEPLSGTQLRETVRSEVESLALDRVPDGGSIAIGVGSRGINEIATITASVVSALNDRGYDPFVFPAMGSHGGATAAGQRQLLAELNVTESTIGCPVRSSMEAVSVGITDEHEIPLWFDAHAAGADGILPINRVKPQTDFDGPIESGIAKILTIGMGKQRGAKVAHNAALAHSFRTVLPECTHHLVENLPVIGGLALLEDHRDETAHVEAISPLSILDREPELLAKATDLLPTLPFDSLDVLVVDRIGKEISGTGMDTNVVRRRPIEPEPLGGNHAITRIYARSLTPSSHGNANGMGIADVVHQDLASTVDFEDTVVNTLTASTIRGAKLPPVVETDRAGVSVCLSTVGEQDPDSVRYLRIRDTMHLETMIASERLVERARERDDLTVLAEPQPLEFTDDELHPFPADV